MPAAGSRWVRGGLGHTPTLPHSATIWACSGISCWLAGMDGDTPPHLPLHPPWPRGARPAQKQPSGWCRTEYPGWSQTSGWHRGSSARRVLLPARTRLKPGCGIRGRQGPSPGSPGRGCGSFPAQFLQGLSQPPSSAADKTHFPDWMGSAPPPPWYLGSRGKPGRACSSWRWRTLDLWAAGWGGRKRPGLVGFNPALPRIELAMTRRFWRAMRRSMPQFPQCMLPPSLVKQAKVCRLAVWRGDLMAVRMVRGADTQGTGRSGHRAGSQPTALSLPHI